MCKIHTQSNAGNLTDNHTFFSGSTVTCMTSLNLLLLVVSYLQLRKPYRMFLKVLLWGIVVYYLHQTHHFLS